MPAHPSTVRIRPATTSDAAVVAAWLLASWGSTQMAVGGRLVDCAALPAYLAERAGVVCGVATVEPGQHGWEVVTCDVSPRREGIGSALVAGVVDAARRAGVTRVCCTTTNDNLPAFGFWQALGFRLVRVRAGAVAQARRRKPSIPERGVAGLPIRDELDLVLDLSDVESGAHPVSRPAVTLVLEGRVPEGGQRPLEAFLAEAVPYYEAPTGIAVRLEWQREDPTRFRETVDYATEEAFEVDDERTRADPRMRDLLARWRALLREGPTVTTWRPGQLGRTPSAGAQGRQQG